MLKPVDHDRPIGEATRAERNPVKTVPSEAFRGDDISASDLGELAKMRKIKRMEVIRGVYWVEIPDAEIYSFAAALRTPPSI